MHLLQWLLEKLAHLIDYSEEAETEKETTQTTSRKITISNADEDESEASVSGLKYIAHFQCLLALMADLSGKDESDRRLLDSIIRSLLGLLAPLKRAVQQQQQQQSQSSADDTTTNTTPVYMRMSITFS